MHITFAPRGILQIEDARITFRNFEGRGDQFNREGDRNFALVIETEEQCRALADEGWNVKVKEPRDPDDSPRMHLPVKVKFNERGPIAYLNVCGRGTRLDEESIGIIDNIDIAGVNLTIRPYDWNVNGKEGRTAYLQSIEVFQDVDWIQSKYAEEESPEE